MGLRMDNGLEDILYHFHVKGCQTPALAQNKSHIFALSVKSDPKERGGKLWSKVLKAWSRLRCYLAKVVQTGRACKHCVCPQSVYEEVSNMLA